jgi:hypothetical protein
VESSDNPKRELSFVIEDQNLEYFEACARIRDISTKALVNRVMRAIATDQLVLAILDDGSERIRQPGEHRFHRKDNGAPSDGH